MINVSQQINAVRRRVGSRTLEAGEARTVIVSQIYQAPAEDVWDACTNPDRIARWFLPVTGDLRAGGRYQLQGNAGGVIESCDPPRSFSATWEYGGEVSWIEVRVTAEPDGSTRLVLEHIALVGDQRWAQFGPGAVGVGWDMGLLGLATHLSTGAAVNPQEVAAWMTSAGGRQFMTASSERWCEANIAAGADEAGARAAAGQTTAAYTGAGPDGR
jgi:uncharacterized protein YndB with AHSA1/START domain